MAKLPPGMKVTSSTIDEDGLHIEIRVNKRNPFFWWHFRRPVWHHIKRAWKALAISVKLFGRWFTIKRGEDA